MAAGEIEKINALEAPWDPRREAIPDIWTSEHVSKRLLEAFETMSRLPRIRGPRMPGNNWPEVFYDAEDKRGWGQYLADREAEKNRSVVRPTAAEIQQMEIAFAWIADLRQVDSGLAVYVQAWGAAKCAGRPLRDLCRKRKWSFKTFYRRLGVALSTIAERANLTRLPVW